MNDYLKLLTEPKAPRADEYLHKLFESESPDITPSANPLLSEARELIKEGQPKERVIRALERLDIEDKATLINQLNESSGDR